MPSGSQRHPTLYLVANSHLDTQWRWTVRDTIRKFLPRTLEENFALFESYPDYVLSFEGAFRYMLVEEYYPKLFAKLRDYVRQGRWRPAGSMLDAADVNIPAPESLIRHVLYASRYFRRAFGVDSADLFLPDCFGFSHTLPTVARHCGLLGFSSQKFIKWMAPAKIPFDLGLWEGPDGSRIPAALNPEGYGDGLEEDLSVAERWIDKLQRFERSGFPPVGYKYFGIGDQGGAVAPSSAEWVQLSVHGAGPLRVIHDGSDRLFRDLMEEDHERLPVFRGELQLPTHGTGCWTSAARLKQLNRRNELLADATERACVAASWFAGARYPKLELSAAWTRFLWHQMHDDLTGTAIPAAYRISIRDALLSLNQFSTLLTDAVRSVARRMNTAVEGQPILVYNPLSWPREDVVEARIEYGRTPPRAVTVRDADNQPVLCQIAARESTALRISFLAAVPALSLSVFSVAPCNDDRSQPEPEETLGYGSDWLGNHRYRLKLDEHGYVASLRDKILGCELLAGPIRFETLPDGGRRWPAWEIRHQDICAPPRPILTRARVRVRATGPLYNELSVIRRWRGSSFEQRVRLPAGGAGERVEIENRIRWRTRGRLLKASFPLACAAPRATYDLGWGVIERGNNRREQYEVPAQQWADLSDSEAGFGVSLLNDGKYGWDKPSDGCLRLSLLRSPRSWWRYRHQTAQDFGDHRFTFAIYSHSGGWADGKTIEHGERLNQPLLAFQAESHPGLLGRSLKLLEIDNPAVRVRALKQAEEGDEWMVRLQESAGKVAKATVRIKPPVASARRSDGREQHGRRLDLDAGALPIDLSPFAAENFALTIEAASKPAEGLAWQPIALDHDTEAISYHGTVPSTVDFDGQGNSLPGELFPPEIRRHEICFRLAGRSDNQATACRGQSLTLPDGRWDTLHLIAAAAVDRDLKVGIEADGRRHQLCIHSWANPAALRPGRRPLAADWTVRLPVAWIGTHQHDRQGKDRPYRFCYLYHYRMTVPAGTTTVRLPHEPKVHLFSAAVAYEGPHAVRPTSPLRATGKG